MNIFIVAAIFAIAVPQTLFAFNFNIQENEELCNSSMKELSICKLRTLLDQATREMEEILMSYSELSGFYGKLNQHAASENPQMNSRFANAAKEKRKSAFVRFGKRSVTPEESSAPENLKPSEEKQKEPLPSEIMSQIKASSHFSPELLYPQNEIQKRKSSYVRFGKREN